MSARLPTTVVPSHYCIDITPDLNKFTFDGLVEIEVTVHEQVNQVVLHAIDFVVSTASVVNAANNQQSPAQVSIQPNDQTMTLQVGQPLEPGKYKVIIRYQGPISNTLAGFYRSSYTVNGQTRYIATTQFEATDARRAFPCWDEPAMKATFDVVLRIPVHLQAISNMPVARTVTDAEHRLRAYYFQRTPIMSTYLLAFIVGEFDSIACYTPEGVEVRVYTPPGRSHLGRFALHVASKALSYYIKLFDIPYPLPKMDLIAIPDFAAGAMENWGCITYRELALLIDESQSSLDRKQRVARTVCHEIAHQWFGNLVTMEWWTHLWLNEGFARFLEFYAVNALFPEWDIKTQFVLSIHGTALRHDSLESSHPIEVPVNHPDEINEIFDVISYAKGASVIRMLCSYLGESTFFKGLTSYLRRHSYQNAKTEDLWKSMEEASGKPVQSLMAMWTGLIGYPVLCFRADSNNKPVAIEQYRFLANGAKVPSSWPIPIQAIVEQGNTLARKDFGLLLPSEEPRQLLEFAAKEPWFKLNAGQEGFYRMLYLPQQYARMAPVIPRLPTVDRLGILSDAFALSKAGWLPLNILLELLESYVNDLDFAIWAELSTNFEPILQLYCARPLYPLLCRYVKQLYERVDIKLRAAIDSTTPDEHKMQFYSVVMNTLAQVDDPETIKRAIAMFEKHYTNIKGISNEPLVHPDLRLTVYSTAVAAGGVDAYRKLHELYALADLPEEKRRCLQAFGATKIQSLLQESLQFALSDAVRHQDIVFALGSVAGNIQAGGSDMAWQFFKDNFPTIDKTFNTGGQSFLLSGIVSVLVGGSSERLANDADEWFKQHKWPSAERAIKQGIESIRLNAARLVRDEANLQQWLQARFAE